MKQSFTTDIQKDFQNLIKLLDDEDKEVYSHVKEEFLKHGSASADYLKSFTQNENVLFSERAKEIIAELSFADIDREIFELSLRNENILEEVCLLISKLEYNELDIDEYQAKLDEMAYEIQKRMDKKAKTIDLTPENIIKIINRYLFLENDFKGNSENFYEPENSFISMVLDRKTGIPISLSILYILLARRLNLPVYGVNMPVHFIIKYVGKKDDIFIDPYNKGIAVSKREASAFLRKMGIPKKEFEKIPYLDVATDKEIISRALRNLIEIYRKRKDESKLKMFEKLNSYFEE